jgi:hypothetical protein
VAIFKQHNFKILEITIFVKLLIFTFLRVLDDNFALEITILSETTFLKYQLIPVFSVGQIYGWQLDKKKI